MGDFQKIFFAENLKKVAKDKFGGIGKLADLIGNSNLSNYTKSNPTEPQAGLLFKLAKQNININYLLTGEGSIMLTDDDRERLNKLEEEITILKAAISGLAAQNKEKDLLLTQNEDEIKELKKELTELKDENTKLRVLNSRIAADLSEKPYGKKLKG